MIVYDGTTGFIISQIPDNQDISIFYHHFSEDFKTNIKSIDDYLDSEDLNKYRVLDGKLVEMSNIEMEEVELYNRILTNDERVENKLLQKITPTDDEITKSETVIDVLELMAEVLK